MANAPITDILFPEDEALSRLVIAQTDATGAAGGVVTLTIADSYPPIDRRIACPILGILLIQNDATLIANGNEGYNITNTMPVTAGAGVAPDSAGEFLVTGDRTINIWRLVNETSAALIAYISKGSGNKV